LCCGAGEERRPLHAADCVLIPFASLSRYSPRAAHIALSRLPAVGRITMLWACSSSSSPDADAIRAVFNQEGELSAAIELRRRFPGIPDNAKARACARSIAGWTPLPAQPRPVTRPAD
jgi:hypothetical protein